MKVGDKIIEINGKRVSHFEQISEIISSKSDTSINLVIQRDNQIKSFLISPEISEGGTPILGISAAYKRTLFDAFAKSVKDTYNLSVKTLLFIGKMITGKIWELKI